MVKKDTRIWTAWRFILCLTISFVMAGSNPAAAQSSRGPRISFENVVFSFGTVREGTAVEAVFPVRNTGDAPLQIERLQTACGCTAAAVDVVPAPAAGQPAAVLAGGQATSIKVTFDTTGFQGKKVKTVRVISNDPNAPATVLTLKGEIEQDIEVDPPRIVFGEVPKGRDVEKTATALVRKGSGFKILDAVSRSEFLEPHLEDVRQNDREGRTLRLVLKKDAPAGDLRSEVTLRTSSDKHPAIVVPVFARVLTDLRPSSPYVSFDLLEGPLTQPVTKEIELVNASEQPINIQSVDVDGSSIRAELKTVIPGKRYQLIVTLLPEAMGTVRSKVTLNTDHPDEDQRTVLVPVYALISRKSD